VMPDAAVTSVNVTVGGAGAARSEVAATAATSDSAIGPNLCISVV